MKTHVPDPARPTVAVMHASGRTGHRLAHRLLATGFAVQALGRSAEALAPLALAGAHCHVGDPRDPAFLADAFAGVDLVYGMLPYTWTAPGYLAQQRRLGEAMASAVQAAGVPRVVFLSSLGAELGSGTGLIGSLHEQEQRLADIPALHAIFLRAGDFMENRLAALPALQEYGEWCDVVDPDRPVPMVATADLAGAACALIASAGWTGLTVHEALGPCDLTYAEVTRILGRRLGKPGLRYRRCSAAALRDLLVGADVPDDVAALTAELSEAIDDGRIRSRFGRSAASTTTTRFEDFVADIDVASGPQAVAG